MKEFTFTVDVKTHDDVSSEAVERIRRWLRAEVHNMVSRQISVERVAWVNARTHG